MSDGPRTLCLLRHAKSSWDDPGAADFDRPLAARGRAAAPRMGAWLAARGLVPDAVICSSALRTRQTWDLVAPALGGRPSVTRTGEIYEAPACRLLAAIRGAPPEARGVLLVGHNPGIQEAAERLAGAGSDPAALARLRRKFPTGAVAVFALDDADWPALGPGGARLVAFVRPKDLAAGDDNGQSQNRAAST
ncbi:MAG: SixA phosphatase family protein [Alphaproteobacteria bacterium]